MAKVYVIRTLPIGNSSEAKAERSHLQGSRWGIAGVPGDGALAGKPYFVEEGVAAALINNSGWVLCDQSGKPTGETLPPPAKPAIRAGTAEWKALPPEERFGSEEWYDFQMQKKLDEAAAAEAPAQPTPSNPVPEQMPDPMPEPASTDQPPPAEDEPSKRSRK